MDEKQLKYNHILACCTKNIITERNTISSIEGREENHGKNNIWSFQEIVKKTRIVSRRNGNGSLCSKCVWN